MQIGDLSRQAGVNIETIRYYERIGVLPKPARQLNGRRTYSPVDAERLGFIRHARELGFDLPSIRILLALQERPEASCEDASRIAQEQLEAVESRIARLLLLQDELARMVRECKRGKVSECRVYAPLQGPYQPDTRNKPDPCDLDNQFHRLLRSCFSAPHELLDPFAPPVGAGTVKDLATA